MQGAVLSCSLHTAVVPRESSRAARDALARGGSIRVTSHGVIDVDDRVTLDVRSADRGCRIGVDSHTILRSY